MTAVEDQRLVVDVSVAVKWFVAEEYNEAATRLVKSGAFLLAPDLFVAELGNVLLKKVKRGELPADALAEAIPYVGLVVQFVPSAPLASTAFQIAQAYGRSFYDALYVALAVHEGCQLVTADERLINGMGSEHRDRLVLLSQLQ